MDMEPIIKPVTYGDGRKAFRWQVLFREKGEPVGITSVYRDRQCMECPTRREAAKAAKAEIERLKGRRLVAFHITKNDIENGEGHNPQTCAVAQSMWRVQEGLGYDHWNWSFEVDTYGAFRKPQGIRAVSISPWEVRTIDPPPVISKCRTGWYEESMEEWTTQYDDWDDSRHMTAREWREETGEDGKPCKPSPGSFVLDLDELFNSVRADR
jgi:hypothetical protein